jgi:hypothetical protein
MTRNTQPNESPAGPESEAEVEPSVSTSDVLQSIQRLAASRPSSTAYDRALAATEAYLDALAACAGRVDLGVATDGRDPNQLSSVPLDATLAALLVVGMHEVFALVQPGTSELALVAARQIVTEHRERLARVRNQWRLAPPPPPEQNPLAAAAWAIQSRPGAGHLLQPGEPTIFG